MKKILFFTVAFLLGVNSMAQSNKIAILDIVDRDNQIEYNTKLMLRSYIFEAVAKSPGCEAYEFSGLDEIIDEYEFLRTGNLKLDEIRKIGQAAGVQQILVIEASQLKASQLFVTAKLINASTAQMEMTTNMTTKPQRKVMQSDVSFFTDQLLSSFIIKNNLQTENVQLVRNSKEVRKKFNKKKYSYGNKDMSEEEMLIFVHERDPKIYKKLKKAKALQISGWVFGGASAMWMIPLYVPLLTEGYKQFDKAIDEFNRTYSGE